MGRIAGQLNPIHAEIFQRYRVHYYWTTHQSEWAVDARFRRPTDLKRWYPVLIQHGMTTFGSPDVLRFLGKRVPLSGQLRADYNGELFSNVKHREEGVRIKHYADGNSLKAYDKAHTPVGSILRVEPTVNEEKPFLVYRPMKRGVADLCRRAEVSQKAAERYLDALASLDDSARLEELARELERPTHWKGKRVRGLVYNTVVLLVVPH